MTNVEKGKKENECIYSAKGIFVESLSWDYLFVYIVECPSTCVGYSFHCLIVPARMMGLVLGKRHVLGP